MQILVAISHAVCTHVGGPKNLGCCPPPPCWEGAQLTPGNMRSPHVLLYQMWSLCAKQYGHRQGVPKKFGDARAPPFWMGWDMADPI